MVNDEEINSKGNLLINKFRINLFKTDGPVCIMECLCVKRSVHLEIFSENFACQCKYANDVSLVSEMFSNVFPKQFAVMFANNCL